MEQKGIIAKVTQPTDWVNSLVIKEKENGKLRVCLCPVDLNKAIKRDHYPTPTLEEITPRLANAKVFSKLDARQGYWNVKLTDESSYLTTFNSPDGRYRFLRMPFGLKMSQDVFQYKIDETYGGCKGAVGLADDIQVFGVDENDHDYNLHEAMERTRKAGIKLNAAKCIVKTNCCSFFGNLYTPEGVKPDPAKIEAISALQAPESKQNLHTFLGMVNHLGQFIPHLSSATEPLRNLMKKDVEFQWNASHEQAFQNIKDLIKKETTLAYYDRKKNLTLEVDSSLRGIGAALVQDGKPIAFASKAFTPAEQRYANIEREMLAVVYGCKKFNTYLYGREFVVESDHKLLGQIQVKNLQKAPPRLQRMLCRIQPYNMEIRYKPGKQMVISDALSRLTPCEGEEIPGMKVRVHHLTEGYPIQLSEIQTTTTEDETLQLLVQQIVKGWPDRIQEIHPALKPFWSLREDLYVEDGIVLIGTRVVIPQALRSSVLKNLHKSHMGIEKTKLLAKDCVYWPGIYPDIDDTVGQCATCQRYQNQQVKEPIIPSDIPQRPWHTVGADLFHTDQRWYVIVSDYYSKFPFIRKLRACDSSTVIAAMKSIFAEQGVPEKMIHDNGPCFISTSFKDFSRIYGFKSVTSSPHYPRGHGLIERHIQTIKKVLLKNQGGDPDLALLRLRSTPLNHKLPSPAELLNARKFRCGLPVRPSIPKESEAITDQLRKQQDEQAIRYNQHAKERRELLPGETVRVLSPHDKTWTLGKVVGTAKTPRSYNVKTDTERQYRRNRNHLRPTKEKFHQNAVRRATTEDEDETQQESQPERQPTTTRSGRVIKAPQKLNL